MIDGEAWWLLLLFGVVCLRVRLCCCRPFLLYPISWEKTKEFSQNANFLRQNARMPSSALRLSSSKQLLLFLFCILFQICQRTSCFFIYFSQKAHIKGATFHHSTTITNHNTIAITNSTQQQQQLTGRQRLQSSPAPVALTAPAPVATQKVCSASMVF